MPIERWLPVEIARAARMPPPHALLHYGEHAVDDETPPVGHVGQREPGLGVIRETVTARRGPIA